MKPNGRNSIFLAGAFALALAALTGLGPASSQIVPTSVSLRSPVPLRDGKYCLDNFCFKRTRKGDDWLLWYRFKGKVEDKWHEVTCSVSEPVRLEIENGYGYRIEERRRELVVRLKETIDQEGTREGILIHGESMVAIDPNEKLSFLVHWSQVVPAGEDAVAREREDFKQWFEAKEKSLMKMAEAKLKIMEDRGFRYYAQGSMWLPDYSNLVVRSARVLKGCIDALNAETQGDPDLLMKFFQSMKFMEVLETDEAGKMTQGVRLPSSVMTLGTGDCDSKATTFCTIQRSQSRQLIIFRSLHGKGKKKLRHALVGVEEDWGKTTSSGQAKSWNEKSPWHAEQLREGLQEEPILIGLRYYRLCEVAGPNRSDFGKVATGHEGYYLVIPIRPIEAQPAPKVSSAKSASTHRRPATVPRTSPRPPAGFPP